MRSSPPAAAHLRLRVNAITRFSRTAAPTVQLRDERFSVCLDAPDYAMATQRG